MENEATRAQAERDLETIRRAWGRWDKKRHITSTEIDVMFRVINNTMLLLEGIIDGRVALPDPQQRPDGSMDAPRPDEGGTKQADRGEPQPAAEV